MSKALDKAEEAYMVAIDKVIELMTTQTESKKLDMDKYRAAIQMTGHYQKLIGSETAKNALGFAVARSLSGENKELKSLVRKALPDVAKKM